MKIKALVPFSNGTLSMEQYEVREVADSLGNELISAGIAVEIGGGLPPVTASDAGKVLGVNDSGVWGVQLLPSMRDNDAMIVATAKYENGAYVSYTSIDTVEFLTKYQTGADVRLYLTEGDVEILLYPTLTAQHQYGEVIIYEAFDLIRSVKIKIVFAIGTETVTATISEIDNRFIVTLTPTSADFSGTMDKTVAEINAAYKAGREIWFKALTSASTSVEIPLTYWATDTSCDYHGFESNLVNAASNMMIVAYVGSSDDGTRQTYDTKIYALTPAT